MFDTSSWLFGYASGQIVGAQQRASAYKPTPKREPEPEPARREPRLPPLPWDISLHLWATSRNRQGIILPEKGES